MKLNSEIGQELAEMYSPLRSRKMTWTGLFRMEKKKEIIFSKFPFGIEILLMQRFLKITLIPNN